MNAPTLVPSYSIREEVAKVLAGQGKQGRRPALWDGKAAERIVAELDRLIQG